MSTPDPNSSASVTVSPALVTAPETPPIPANNLRTTPPQPAPAPRYRAIAPVQHANPFQQTHNNNLQSHSTPNRRPHSPQQLHHQDPSTVLYPCTPPGRGFSARPVRMSSPLVADPSVTAGNQSGYRPRPVLAYNHGPFSRNQETMMQFMRPRNPQIHQLSYPVSRSPARPGPLIGVPYFLQPRDYWVPPPPTSILDTPRNKHARRRDGTLVLVRGRNVRITEGASLYSLTRSWLRNGDNEGVQWIQRSGTMKPLPKPLPVDVMEAAVPNDPAKKPNDEDKEDEESVDELTEKDLLNRHIERAKKVRARLREERLRKMKRFKPRLALLLQQSREAVDEE